MKPPSLLDFSVVEGLGLAAMFGGLLFAIGFSFIFSAWALARLIRDEMGGLFMGAAFTFIWMVAVVIIVERYRT